MGILKAAVHDFSEDEAMTLAAALAFYAALSLAPMILLLIWIGEYLGPEAKSKLLGQVESYAGPQASESVRIVVENASSTPEMGTIAGIISIGATVVAATGVLAQLQYAMNRIWDVPPHSSAVKAWFRKRALSLLMILIFGAVLVASLVMSAMLSAVKQSGVGLQGVEYLWTVLNAGISLIVMTLLFAAVFNLLPDAEIGWRPTWLGAFVTAVFFLIGRWLVGLYLVHSTAASAYGAAGSLFVLLMWVYYSALIFLFGVELTHVWAQKHGWKVGSSEAGPRGQVATA